MTGADIVAEAREWLRTPFVWQASAKGIGADCKGLIWGVARELGLPEAQSPYAAIADYRIRVPVQTLRRGLVETLRQVEAPEPGDILLLRMGKIPQHLGFFAGDAMIHTYNRGPASMVIVTPIAVALRAWPMVAAFRFRSVEG